MDAQIERIKIILGIGGPRDAQRNLERAIDDVCRAGRIDAASLQRLRIVATQLSELEDAL